MKTIYLFRSMSNNVNFGCDDRAGLFFIESAVDVTFLDNVVVDDRLKLQVDQKTGDRWAGKSVIWFIVITDKPYSNRTLEKEFAYVRNIGNQLFKKTRLGQEFSYKDIYTIPNVDDSWRIDGVRVNLNEDGTFKEVCFLDCGKPVESNGRFTCYEAEVKSIRPDIVFCIGGENQQTQCQYVHLTMPTNININASGLRVSGDLKGFHLNDTSYAQTTEGFILEIYNNAITTKNIFTSFLLLFQIIEVIIDSAPSTKIDEHVVSEIQNEIERCDLVESRFARRILGVLRGIKKETSRELLEIGTILLIGQEAVSGLKFEDFSSWRKFRGKITHHREAQLLTDREFVAHYRSIRAFVDAVMLALVK